MATANFSSQTTHSRSVLTLDGYVSRGMAPPDSVPRYFAILQEFTLYLELRLKCVNMPMLRRIFADFLNDHENTLVPMMKQGCTIVTIYPVLSTNAQRRHQAELLLAKPKQHLDAHGCVFLYLQYRTATRNMMLLKHLFKEFVYHQDATLLEFVKRGCQVISVIPFELPQAILSVQPPPRVKNPSPTSDAATEQQHACSKTAIDVAGPLISQKKKRGRQKKPKTNAAEFEVPGGSSKQKSAWKRKSKTTAMRTSDGSEEKPKKRGKTAMSEEECRNQVKLARKMETFEAQIPWEAVFDNHSRAVWERKFWSPVSRKVSIEACNKRSNRQLIARNAFESLLISAYKELGAEFFVKLDTQKPRHRGWWYREPVVALLALQQMKGEEFMWDYVMNEGLKRFPDCHLPLPLTASNTGAKRIQNKRASASVWIINPQTAVILCKMAELKAAELERQ
ncbi:hypothetical protein PInf_008712 [Phytophthora infestans]|nr:hypothetical protein PInf_008712 [Phytophthora infestans]